MEPPSAPAVEIGHFDALFLQKLLRVGVVDFAMIGRITRQYRERAGQQPLLELLCRRVEIPQPLIDDYLAELPTERDRPGTRGRAPELAPRLAMSSGGYAKLAPPPYQVIKRFDDGTPGVLLAREEGSNRIGVLQLLSVPAPEQAAALERIERWRDRQAGCAATAQIHHHGTHGGRLFLFSEFVAGITLETLLAHREQPERILRLLAEVAGVLGTLHEAGLVHGDLRPANLSVRADGGVVLAQPTHGCSPLELYPGFFSPCWAPEVFQVGQRALAPASDVYSLGAMLYRAVTGQQPYEADSSGALLMALLQQTVPSPRALVPALDRTLDAICMTSLELDANLRYRQADQLALDLNRHLQGEASDRGDSKRARAMAPGALLGSYQLGRELGHGGMGTVYQARHEGLGRDVALKLVHRTGPLEHQRFLSEARMLAELKHPHIVEIYDVGEADGQVYLAIELLAGETLEDRIPRDRPMPWREVVAVLTPICRALALIHERGVIHRDLKPANILFADDGRPKLADFGLAKALEGGASLTSTGALVGTPYYMSPETADGQRELTPASDVFSFGALMYRCLSGQVPHPGQQLSRVIVAILKQPPRPLREVNGTVPPELARVCHKALAKDPAARYPDAGALLRDLERLAEAPSGQPAALRAAPRGMPRGAVWRGLLVGALLLVAGVALLRGPRPSQPAAAPDPVPQQATDQTRRRALEQSERTRRERAQAELIAEARSLAGRGSPMTRLQELLDTAHARAPWTAKARLAQAEILAGRGQTAEARRLCWELLEQHKGAPAREARALLEKLGRR